MGIGVWGEWVRPIPVKPETPDMAGHRNLYGLGTTGR